MEIGEPRLFFEATRRRLQRKHHAHCLFQNDPPVEGLRFSFRDDGSLQAKILFDTGHQGYDGMVHGGLLSAVIDASMAQCLMGHGVVAYTADLKLTYKKPVEIHSEAQLQTRVYESYANKLYRLESLVFQHEMVCVRAHARFFRALSKEG